VSDEAEVRLPGGNTSVVVRVGDTVRRQLRPTSPVVHELLVALEAAGFDASPRFLGIDDKGREILTYLEGDVAEPPYGPDVQTEQALVSVARLLRRFHEAVPGWCHNDVAPYNIVYLGPEAVGFIDWDFAAPGPPAWDLAHVAWHCIPCMDDAVAVDHGWSPLPDRAWRLRLLCDAYGLEDRDGFVALISERIAGTADGIRSWAAAGDPVFQRLLSHIPMMDAARAYLARDGDRLQASL
jgi:aminoglycoside phosphotransferase (APT) family kinase protein